MTNARHTAETTQARNDAAKAHGPHAALFVMAFDAATELLDATHAVYDTEAYKADGIDPTEQTRFEIGERGDDVVADALAERGVDVYGTDADGDVWGDADAYDVMVDAVAAACEAWQPHDTRVDLATQAAAALAKSLGATHSTCAAYHGACYVEDERMPTVHSNGWHVDFLLADGGCVEVQAVDEDGVPHTATWNPRGTSTLLAVAHSVAQAVTY